MSPPDERGLKKKIQALIFFRVVFITLFFGSSFLFKGLEQFFHGHSLYYFIGCLYGLSIIYGLLYGRIGNLAAFAYVQLLLDVTSATVLIFITGGIESWLSFTLVIIIISSSIVLNKKAGFIIATVSSIIYGMLANLQLYGFLPAYGGSFIRHEDYLYRIFTHVIFFYITAYLSGYLSSRLEKTVQKLDEKDLDIRDLEFFSRRVVESLPSGLFTTDVSGRVVLFNRGAERITGIQRDSVIGRKIDTVLPFFPFPFSEGRRDEVITVNGTQKDIGLTISQLTGISESTRGFVVVFQDLTQIKKLETEIQQKEKWAAIGELSANIAHEIRNPLASLKGSIEMLREDSVPGNYKDRLMEIALNEMERLNRIITDFLTYSRPGPPEKTNLDIHMVLDDIIELLKNIDQNKGRVSIRKNYEGTLTINADPLKMRQVFWNLGINAVEAMPEGGDLTVSTRDVGDSVSITFEDTGPGIDEKYFEKLFYPFFTTKEQGTGLGLAIAYRIVEEHKGTIQVLSEKGMGTTFAVTIPRSDEKA